MPDSNSMDLSRETGRLDSGNTLVVAKRHSCDRPQQADRIELVLEKRDVSFKGIRKHQSSRT